MFKFHAALATLATLAALPLNCTAQDWRSFQPAWQIGLHTAIVASPVIANDTLYVGAENGNLHAFSLKDRSLQWLFHARGAISSTPAVANGLVYFLSRDGSFHALNAADGAPRWTFRTQGESYFATYGMYGMPTDGGPAPDPWDFYLSSPVVHKGKVYFGSSDERVYALDAASGKLAWSFKTGGVIHSSPAVANDTVLVGAWDGVLYALDAQTGAERWRFKTETEQQQSIMLGIQSSPTVDRETVYIGARDGYLYALDLATGVRKWRYNAQGSWIVATPAIDDARLYVGTSDTGLLVALDKRTCREIYRYDTKVWTFSSPLLAGDTLWVANMKGELFALQAGTGQLRWRHQSAEGRADAYRILDANGKFDNARLYGTQPHQTYAALEHVKRLGAYLGSPVWYRNQLIIANALGQVEAYGSTQ